ncbi:hypothetical protein [Rhodococcus pyridinivorans]|uniref:Uncharacterized protein n=1 Tax=Rhodococcus pyridinivorans TaxID=103816 RepID=A0A7M2XWI8_9NOCA|nr:hypothetical protein [Rhodococcus pyridinivorans]QOW01684.1 hypothetical protein INP59_26380 [Rhodococcus pyridinivorans]
MASTSHSASRRSLRPHTTPNVRENARRQRERLLARQTELEALAGPIHEATDKLSKLEATVASRAQAPLKKIERLEQTRDRRIKKIQEQYAAKIAEIQQEMEAGTETLTPQERERESSLLREYAEAIVTFSRSASASELAPLLGVSTREAKTLIMQAKADLGVADAAESAAPASDDKQDDKQTVPAAS